MEYLLASEFFQQQSSANLFENFGPSELERLLHALYGIEAALLSAKRTKGGETPRQGLKDSEAKAVRKALDLHQWNITETARALGIGRNTLYRKIKQFTLSR